MSGGCEACKTPANLDFEFAMAYQPIVDAAGGGIYAHEALVRGPNGESAGSILSKVTDENRYWFDQQCRVRAIETAASLGMPHRLSINFLPNAVYQPEACLRLTMKTAAAVGFPVDRIIFEVTESERVVDFDKLAAIINTYKQFGLTTAIDDFGAGYSGLNLLSEFQPDIIKLDMALTRDIEGNRVKRSIVSGILGVCRELDITAIAEGVETPGEYATLRDMGVSLFQGYLFARPQFRNFVPEIDVDACLAAQS